MPFGASDTIHKALAQLLASKGGFVIFEDENGDFVQFSLEPDGLNLFWPEVSRIEAERVTPLLEQAGVKYETADDGVYGHFGRDAERVVTFTLRAFRELFGHEPKELKTEIELDQP